MLAADFRPGDLLLFFNREQTFDIDVVAPTCRKKKSQKSLPAEQKGLQLVCFQSLSLSSFSRLFPIEAAHRGEIKAHSYAISEANFIYRRSSSLPNCRGTSDGHA